MKAERRHELHQNDLAQWLGKAWQWIKAHGNHLTAAVLVVAVVFFAWVLIARHLQSREDAVSDTYRQAMVAVSDDERLTLLKEVAEQDRNPFWAAKASLDLANLYALKLVSADKIDVAQQQAWVDQATKFYTRVTELASRNEGLKPLAAQGYLGLGQLAVSARRFDEAEALFKRAQETAPEGYPAHTYAGYELRELPRIRTAPEQFAAEAAPSASDNRSPLGPMMDNPALPGLLTLPDAPFGNTEPADEPAEDSQ
jgi:tetratricopeptide (TPR) repeat protein